jgi:hypothetical protein
MWHNPGYLKSLTRFSFLYDIQGLHLVLDSLLPALLNTISTADVT